MPVEQELLTYMQWLPFAILRFGIAIAVLLFFGTFFTYVAAAVRLGPSEAFYLIARIMLESVPDWIQTSPRRLYALARLTFKESLRGRVWVVFLVFSIILLFAGWYLDTESNDPARLYISFVLNATNYLMLVLGFVMSTFSLPSDIKSRIMYTITTKPVRAGEIVMGRFLGFAAWGTLLMSLMGISSYFFVTRGLDHSHQLEADSLIPIDSAAGKGQIGEKGQTTFDKHHRHEITINNEGVGRTDTRMGHWHPVTKSSDGKVTIGPAEGMLQARVPLAGKLAFTDRAGRPTASGINVGNEWMYRSYIEGDTLQSAIWTFDGVTPEMFPEGLPLEMTIRVFRSYKGDIEQGIGGTVQLVNPDPSRKVKVRSEKIYFVAQEFVTYEKFIPRKLKGISPEGKTIELDLFEDLVYEGKLQLELKCSDPAQYFGVAQRDVYLHAADNYFAVNFLKGYVDLWLKMMIAIAFGTMFSTFLSGPVAMLGAIASMVVGFVSSFIFGLAGVVTDESEKVVGGGPIESTYRLITQKNLTIDTDLPGAVDFVMKNVDLVLIQSMRAIANLLPNYNWFDTSKFVAYGMNIDADATAQHATLAIAYILVVLVVGYFFMKTREIAA